MNVRWSREESFQSRDRKWRKAGFQKIKFEETTIKIKFWKGIPLTYAQLLPDERGEWHPPYMIISPIIGPSLGWPKLVLAAPVHPVLCWTAAQRRFQHRRALQPAARCACAASRVGHAGIAERWVLQRKEWEYVAVMHGLDWNYRADSRAVLGVVNQYALVQVSEKVRKWSIQSGQSRVKY